MLRSHRVPKWRSAWWRSGARSNPGRVVNVPRSDGRAAARPLSRDDPAAIGG